MERGFVKRIEPGAPEEQVRELQVASENHPRDAQREDDEVGETSVADNLADGEERQGSDGEHHHLAVVTAIDVSEIFRRERIEESEKRTPPLVAGQVPGEEHGAHERDPDREDELEADSACRIHDELSPHERVVGVGEQSIHRRDATEAAIVPFREDDVKGAQDAAADAVQLVAVEHELTGIECEIAEDYQQNCKENCGHGHKESGLLVEKIHEWKYKNTAAGTHYGLLNCSPLNESAFERKLFERVFVCLCRLDKAVNAECRDDANGGEYDILDHFHKVLLSFSIKIFVFCETVKCFF